MSGIDLKAIYQNAAERYDEYKASGLKLDMSRGKPCKEQLDLSMGVLNCSDNWQDNQQYRNYGMVDGIPEAKKLFADMLEVSESEIIIGGNSSLNMMYDTIVRALLKGVPPINEPWGLSKPIKFLCPSPGYDRHFDICREFGIEMITVDMTKYGPDIHQIEELVTKDETIKGIWCVPKYSNPDGITYSDHIVDRLASMKTKAKDFRIFWDNAYCVHHLSEKPDQLKNILQACKDYGNADRVFIFSSTSKISFPGAGIAMMASSEKNIAFIKNQISIQTIGPDKLNQWRHIKYFKDLEGITKQMKKHAAILKPKFELVLNILQEELGGLEIAWWNSPRGGYFISLYTLDNCAAKIVKKAAEAGLILTQAGATYPYKKDPRDRNIRIAPTFPSINELEKAIKLLCLCVQLVSIEKYGDKLIKQTNKAI